MTVMTLRDEHSDELIVVLSSLFLLLIALLCVHAVVVVLEGCFLQGLGQLAQAPEESRVDNSRLLKQLLRVRSERRQHLADVAGKQLENLRKKKKRVKILYLLGLMFTVINWTRYSILIHNIVLPRPRFDLMHDHLNSWELCP